VPRFGAEGRFEGFIGCCLDVTERRALEEQVRQSQKMESVGRLAAGVAHDFNNILTVILGNASLLPAVNGDIGRAAAEITAAAQRAARLTRQLLVFSRQQPFRTRALEIHELIRGFMGMAARLVGEDVRIVFHPAGHRSFVQADPVLLEQVLLNLAVNARDAMPRGGTLTILTRRCDAAGQPELSFGDFPSHVLVSVSDTGPGIPASILPRIFEPFFTTKEVGKGTGLGLATAYGIVEQHGGRISAWNAHAGGACFEILLPLTTDPERAEPVDRMSAGTVGGAERLLVVEDDPGLLRLATTFLERHGYSVTPASSGVDALRVWQERAGAFDLLLTDIVMPGGIDGLRLARLLRAGRAELKVIYMSGYSPEFATAEASGLTPGVDFLQKPYDMDALVRMVRERLDAEAVPV
jgi:nitrogen-specific signal transduction histidine kinase/CheY-like chemotaxis protein